MNSQNKILSVRYVSNFNLSILQNDVNEYIESGYYELYGELKVISLSSCSIYYVQTLKKVVSNG